VGRIHATPTISSGAVVQYRQSVWDRAMRQLIREPVCPYVPTVAVITKADDAIAIDDRPSYPQPAVIGASHSNIWPKPRFQRTIPACSERAWLRAEHASTNGTAAFFDLERLATSRTDHRDTIRPHLYLRRGATTEGVSAPLGHFIDGGILPWLKHQTPSWA
jgi:hypothetical protein